MSLLGKLSEKIDLTLGIEVMKDDALRAFLNCSWVKGL